MRVWKDLAFWQALGEPEPQRLVEELRLPADAVERIFKAEELKEWVFDYKLKE